MSAPIVLTLRILLAVSLYAFLAWTFMILWRDLQMRGSTLASRRVPRIGLVIESPNQGAKQRYFNQTEILIGRDTRCDVPLADGTSSTRHARLSFHHGQWWLEDLGSTNGTRLNQEPLSFPTVIIGGDEIECGKTFLTIDLGGQEPKTQRIQDKGEHDE